MDEPIVCDQLFHYMETPAFGLLLPNTTWAIARSEGWRISTHPSVCGPVRESAWLCPECVKRLSADLAEDLGDHVANLYMSYQDKVTEAGNRFSFYYAELQLSKLE